MAVTWTIQGGTVATDTDLDDLGISGLIRIRRSLALDEVRFAVDDSGIDGAELLSYGDTITIKRTEGSTVTWFKGQIVEVPRMGNDRAEGMKYRAVGVWWYFENLVYQQIWPLDATANSHLTSPTTYRRALAIVGLVPSSGLRQSTKAFVQDVLDYIIAASGSPPVQYTAGDLPTGFNVPFTRLNAPTCAEAMRWVCRWMPDAASWFDYTTSPPTFNLKRRSGATAVDLAFADIRSLDVRARPELKLDHLLIQYVTRNASGTLILNEEKDPSGTTGKEWGAAVFTFDNNYEALPSGLAANYRAGLSTLQYSGTCVIEEHECSQTIRPGHLLNITDGLAAWETMNAQVQEVMEEIDEGKTTITFGPPEHIRLADLVEILKIARNQVDETGGTGQVLTTGKQSNTFKTLKKDFSPAAAVPTALEIAGALEDAYTDTSQPAPREGDSIDLTIDSALRYSAWVYKQDPGGGYVVGLTPYGVTYYAKVLVTAALRSIIQTLLPAATTPTQSEIRTGLVSAFTSTARPMHGDKVVFTISSKRKLIYTVDFNLSAADETRVVDFTISGRTWYAVLQQLGIL